MKSTFSFFIFLIFGNVLLAQNYTGQVIYQQRLITTPYERSGNPQADENHQIGEIVAKLQFDKDYTLDFNQGVSICKIESPLSISSLSHPKLPATLIDRLANGKQLIYKNMEKNVQLEKIDNFFGRFLISDSLKKIKWQLLPDVKKIGNYDCHKAIFTKNINIDQRKQNADGTFELIKTVQPQQTIAWYTPQIPVSNGPGEFGGLPGLILEVTLNNFINIVATEIVFTNKKNVREIVPPTGGKLVTREEYEKATTARP